jgi:antitoxin VapB
MTQDHSALLAQLDALKSADAGAVFAELIRAGLQALIEAEATEAIGAGRYERAASSQSVAPSRISLLIYNIDMALSIKHPEADRLARELAARTGETLTEAVVVALRERLARETGRARATPLREELAAIRHRCATLPVIDNRRAEEILGYDERGLPA